MNQDKALEPEVAAQIVTCRKCGAVGTNHCFMPGCPLPSLKVETAPVVSGLERFAAAVSEMARLERKYP